MDDIQTMREGVAKEYGIALFRVYSEPEAAHFLKIDLSTLKRWRRAGKTAFVNMGERKVRYLGIHIADMMIKGADWHDTSRETFKSENSGSPGETGAPHGTAHGTTPKLAKPDARLLAQIALRKPSNA